jgi:hypothetical protein
VNKENSPRTCTRGVSQYGLTLSIIFIIYTFFMGGNYQTFSKFFFSYLKFDKFNLSTEAASWGMTLYWLSYSVCIIIVFSNSYQIFNRKIRVGPKIQEK